jgi:hypothetical protein
MFSCISIIRDAGQKVKGTLVLEMVTHRFSIEEAPEAFALFDQGKTAECVSEWD